MVKRCLNHIGESRDCINKEWKKIADKFFTQSKKEKHKIVVEKKWF